MEQEFTLPFDQFIKKPTGKRITPLIYRGGKISLTEWIIPYLPPHKCYVEVFGGGGGLFFAKSPSEVEVYNDVGNVAKFFKVLRDHGGCLYRNLYFTVYSREFFDIITEACDNALQDAITYDNAEYWIRWACIWYTQILQSYRHEEDDHSWGGATPITYSNHIDDLPAITRRLKEVTIENKSFESLIPDYDSKDTLFYCDPPYVPGTWEDDKGGYRNIMSVEKHIELLELLNKVEGHVVLSGYPSDLYEKYTKGWRRVTKTRLGGIKNGNQQASQRTEVLWIRSNHAGLWSGHEEQEISQTDVSSISSRESDLSQIRAFRERNGLR